MKGSEVTGDLLERAASYPLGRAQIAVIMACHNRKDKTLACLASLCDAAGSDQLDVFLFDDGSTDGTSEAVRERFSNVQIIKGDGTYFWARGMRTAWEVAKKLQYSKYLLVNDDDVLDRDSISRLNHWSEQLGERCLIGCSMRHPESELASYGGMLHSGVNPFRFRHVQPRANEPMHVDVLHGNFVCVSSAIVDEIGTFADYLIHQGGDIEYSLRARRAGFEIRLLPGTYGVCEHNPPRPRYRGFRGIRSLTSIKSMPTRVAIRLYREYCGRLWALWLSASYAKAFIFGF
ncbi:MAG TPA: glycosyltransferase family 2 protein [Fimbriimonas sp.]|nr:glycosyltransferase family 2 protein [Fimbriimonas sp.]